MSHNLIVFQWAYIQPNNLSETAKIAIALEKSAYTGKKQQFVK
jgi:hypothetical protein